MMSKVLKVILPVALPFLLILQSLNITLSQNVTARIKVPSSDPKSVSVSGRFYNWNKPNFWFLREIGGYGQLGNRIRGVSLEDATGKSVGVHTLMPGEYFYKFSGLELSNRSLAAKNNVGGGGPCLLDNVRSRTSDAR